MAKHTSTDDDIMKPLSLGLTG